MKLIVLVGVSYAALKECGDGSQINLSGLLPSCEKLNGSLVVDKHIPDKLELQEVTGGLDFRAELPSYFQKPLKVSKLKLDFSSSADINFSHIIAEEIDIRGHFKGLVFNTEPSVFIWRSGSFKHISGIKGSHLRNVELRPSKKGAVQFEDVKSLDSLTLSYPSDFSIFPNLKEANVIKLVEYQRDINLDIETADTIEIQFRSGAEGEVRLGKLTTVHNSISVIGSAVKFSAPRLTWGRLVFNSQLQTLELNQGLEWIGKARFDSSDFCEKYYNAFNARKLQFDTPNSCNAIYRRSSGSNTSTSFLGPYTGNDVPLKAVHLNRLVIRSTDSIANQCESSSAEASKSLAFSNENTHSTSNINKVAGTLKVSNSNYFSVPKLVEIQGSLAVMNSKFFSAACVSKITGDLEVMNSGHFSAPVLDEMQGNLIILNSYNSSVAGHLKIGKELSIENSPWFAAPNLIEVQGSLKVLNSKSFSSPSITKIGGNLKISNSGNFSLSKLKEIKGNLEVLNSGGLSSNALISLEKADKVHLGYDGSSLNFNSLKSITSLRISGSPLVNVTGIDVDHLDNLILESCPYLNHIPLMNLKSLNNLLISSTYSFGISSTNNIVITSSYNNVFYSSSGSNEEPNEDKLKSVLQENILKPLCAIGRQITLEGNADFQALYQRCSSIVAPIESTKLQMTGFKDMKLVYNLKARVLRVFPASKEKDLPKQYSSSQVTLKKSIN
ncbi:hypothetical protein DSO57_1032955 [Entomophthora muscae]|uniref:Uncharacterized protein n=1 Tax=Entomophthora muscae TaxID=34485 RepID=A0ACC2SPF0_9FUNG|nr:hypothetical protein DSO57_1032955 [Entomophthora muscae]